MSDAGHPGGGGLRTEWLFDFLAGRDETKVDERGDADARLAAERGECSVRADRIHLDDVAACIEVFATAASASQPAVAAPVRPSAPGIRRIDQASIVGLRLFPRWRCCIGCAS